MSLDFDTNSDPIYDGDITESVGTLHMVQCWGEQGKPVSKVLLMLYTMLTLPQHNPGIPSADLRGHGSADRMKEARAYLYATELQSNYIDKILAANDPEMYNILRGSANASRWYTELNAGCTVGLATVWKCQVAPHIDRHDWELCVIVCGGNYSGGHLYLPDLDLCLEYGFFSDFKSPYLYFIYRYKPGDIVIFRSPYLYHGIGPWEPGPMLPGHTCTPGRVSWVHFTHEDVVEHMVGKEPGYFAKGTWTLGKMA